MLIIDMTKMVDGDDIVPFRVQDDDTNRLTSARSTKMRELVDHLQSLGPVPRVFGHLMRNELEIFSNHPSNLASVRIWPDWPDYGPVHDGLPVLHYRIQVQYKESHLSQDARAPTIVEAERVILQALGWSRPEAGET